MPWDSLSNSPKKWATRSWNAPWTLCSPMHACKYVRIRPMPLHDRRTMEGVYSVAQTAQMVRQYRYAEEQMMRIMAGWIALTPELVVKLEFGRQVWDCAQHADILGKRLPELRA